MKFSLNPSIFIILLIKITSTNSKKLFFNPAEFSSSQSVGLLADSFTQAHRICHLQTNFKSELAVFSRPNERKNLLDVVYTLQKTRSIEDDITYYVGGRAFDSNVPYWLIERKAITRIDQEFFVPDQKPEFGKKCLFLRYKKPNVNWVFQSCSTNAARVICQTGGFDSVVMVRPFLYKRFNKLKRTTPQLLMFTHQKQAYKWAKQCMGEGVVSVRFHKVVLVVGETPELAIPYFSVYLKKGSKAKSCSSSSLCIYKEPYKRNLEIRAVIIFSRTLKGTLSILLSAFKHCLGKNSVKFSRTRIKRWKRQAVVTAHISDTTPRELEECESPRKLNISKYVGELQVSYLSKSGCTVVLSKELPSDDYVDKSTPTKKYGTVQTTEGECNYLKAYSPLLKNDQLKQASVEKKLLRFLKACSSKDNVQAVKITHFQDHLGVATKIIFTIFFTTDVDFTGCTKINWSEDFMSVQLDNYAGKFSVKGQAVVSRIKNEELNGMFKKPLLQFFEACSSDLFKKMDVIETNSARLSDGNLSLHFTLQFRKGVHFLRCKSPLLNHPFSDFKLRKTSAGFISSVFLVIFILVAVLMLITKRIIRNKARRNKTKISLENQSKENQVVNDGENKEHQYTYNEPYTYNDPYTSSSYYNYHQSSYNQQY